MIDTRTLQAPGTVSVARSRRIRLAIVAGVTVLAGAAGIGTWQATAHSSSAPAGSSAVVQTSQQLGSFQQLKDEGYPDSAQRLASLQQLKDGK
jgi:hypothetical protein